MVAVDPLPAITKLYHFTDVRNLPMIKKLDGLLCTGQLARSSTKLFHPGSSDWSWEQDLWTGMEHYVQLCWDKNHHRGKNIREDIELFYLEIDRRILYERDVLFTTDVANKKIVRRYTVPEAVAGGMIDYDAINKGIGPRYQTLPTEILVPEFLSMKWITNFPEING